MKKTFTFILLVVLLIIGSSCGKKEDKIKILMPEGIPTIALAGALETKNCEFTIVSGTDVITSELMQNNYDVIIAPIIMGAQLYLKDKLNYELSHILTTGNSFVVCREENELNSLKDLEGETIAVYGQNTAPDIALKAALISNDVDISKINFIYENSVMDVLTNRFMGTAPVKYILSTEPAITKITDKFDIKIKKIDIQETLKEEIELIPQAGIFLKKNNNEEIVNTLMEEIDNNVHKITVSKNVYLKEIREYDGEYRSIFDSYTDAEMLNCMMNKTIVFYDAYTKRDELNAYFDMLNKYNENLFSGEINEAFYKK